MIKRIALFVGSIAAAGVLALGLAASGFGPTSTLADTTAANDQALSAAAADQLPTQPVVQVQTETVYVKPAPAPQIVHVTRKLPAAKPKVVTTTKHITTPRVSHGDDGGNEGQDD